MDDRAAFQRKSVSEFNPHKCPKSSRISEMSKRTCSVPSDPFESSYTMPHSSRQFALSSESRCMSASPDTNSISSLSETKARSSPYINTGCCFNERSSVCNTQNSTLSQGDVLCAVTSNMDETFTITPINDSQNVWNQTFNHIQNEQFKFEAYSNFHGRTEDRENDEVTPPGSAGRESKLSSGDSCRGSSENDCCSLSSGEMVIRSNSFCLEEQSIITFSLLEESNISPAASHLSLAAESNLLSACERSTDRMSGSSGHPCLGVTFIQSDNSELLTEKNDISTPSSLVGLPSENERGLLTTFICETSTDLTNAEVEQLPCFLGESTPDLGKTFVSSVSAIQESADIQTSTPIQNIQNKMPPPLSLSPCIENVREAGLQPVKSQLIPATPKQCLVTGLTASLSKVRKMDIKRFPKSDFSSVKSKVLSKTPCQLAVASPASQQKSDPVIISNKHTEANRTTIRVSPAKVISRTAASKMLHDSHGLVNTRATNLGVTVKQPCGLTAVDGQSKTIVSSSDHHPAKSGPASAAQSSESTSETMQAASSQVSDASAHQADTQICSSSKEKSPARSGQMNPKPTSKKDASNKIGVGSCSAVGQDKPTVGKTRPRCSSDSSSASRPPKERRAILRVATSFTLPKADRNKGLIRTGSLKSSSQNKRADEPNRHDSSSREVKKISLVAELGNSSSAGAPLDESKSRSHCRPSPRQGRGTSFSQPPAASPRPTPLLAKHRAECRISRPEATPHFQKHNAGNQRVQAAEQPSISIKPQLNGTRPPQTPTRPSLMGPPITPASRLPRKKLGPPTALTECSDHSELGSSSRSTPGSGRAAHKPTPLKSVVLKAKLISTSVRNSGPALTTPCRSAPSTSKGASLSTVSPVKRTTYGRTVGPNLSGSVDKSKSSSCQEKPQQPTQSFGSQNVVNELQGERRDQNIQQLKQLLTDANHRFQAVIIVLQQVLATRDEAIRQSRELSQELVNLQGELACSVHSSERLEREKEELRAALQDASQKLQEQHQKDLAELEQRLQTFYQAEWDKVFLSCQQEADKCRTLMQQQMEELKASHEGMKLKLESSHEEQLQCVQQQYEMSLTELRNVHTQELQRFDRTSNDAKTALSREIEELTVKNNALMEKLAADENRRKQLAESNQKDSHTLYLEQELESLKVVLDLKNNQLHQQEKKLAEINKLTDKNVKLEESLIKVQQENEDLKARMERHAALSRQLSTEQAVLQESLQKESKVNKRLSMENEELLWKLHNGELSSPHKVSPTSPSASPSHSFKLQSPRSSGLFSSPPVSPR